MIVNVSKHAIERYIERSEMHKQKQARIEQLQKNDRRH
jgi:hypothetical protein